MVKDKKAFLRTVEVFIAAVLTFMFLVVFLPKYMGTDFREHGTDLSQLQQDVAFRNCAIADDEGCINMTIDSYMPQKYEYVFTISPNVSSDVPAVPPKGVFTDSFFIASNNTVYSQKIVRVYYWVR